ncbi:hypothetical protein FACS189472_06550 [Alphaproteobacteria bacterium]|nr:hypothetical protein FACS189472_06550 [Alphaproteobacteria bacterium]
MDGTSSVAIEFMNEVTGIHSFVFGYSNEVEGNNIVAIGNEITNVEANTIVIGGASQNTKITGSLNIGASGGNKQLYLNSMEIKVVNPTSTAQETGETYSGKKVYIKTYESSIDPGVIEIDTFFPSSDSKFISVGGYIQISSTFQRPIQYFEASNSKFLISKSADKLQFDFQYPSLGPREVKV